MAGFSSRFWSLVRKNNFFTMMVLANKLLFFSLCHFSLSRCRKYYQSYFIFWKGIRILIIDKLIHLGHLCYLYSLMLQSAFGIKWRFFHYGKVTKQNWMPVFFLFYNWVVFSITLMLSTIVEWSFNKTVCHVVMHWTTCKSLKL